MKSLSCLICILTSVLATSIPGKDDSYYFDHAVLEVGDKGLVALYTNATTGREGKSLPAQEKVPPVYPNTDTRRWGPQVPFRHGWGQGMMMGGSTINCYYCQIFISGYGGGGGWGGGHPVASDSAVQAPTHNEMDLFVLVSPSFAQMFDNDEIKIKEYVDVIIRGVNNIYKENLVGANSDDFKAMVVVVKGFMILDESQDSQATLSLGPRVIDGDGTRTRMGKFLSSLSDCPDCDNGLLLTTKQVSVKGGINQGYATRGGVCGRNKDGGWSGVAMVNFSSKVYEFIMQVAHELAHKLGATDEVGTGYIMSASGWGKSNRLKFSPKSTQDIIKNVNSDKSNCLRQYSTVPIAIPHTGKSVGHFFTSYTKLCQGSAQDAETNGGCYRDDLEGKSSPEKCSQVSCKIVCRNNDTAQVFDPPVLQVFRAIPGDGVPCGRRQRCYVGECKDEKRLFLD